LKFWAGQRARKRANRSSAPHYSRLLEENEAEQYGDLTAVDRWKETLRRMGHEVSHGHVTSEDKRRQDA
jgi:hypothetical protein